MNTLEGLRQFLEERGMEQTLFFENPSFVNAIVGVTDDDRLVYSYEKMIPAAIEEYPEWTEEDAIDWIEVNTLRTIPYMESYGRAPLVIYHVDAE